MESFSLKARASENLEQWIHLKIQAPDFIYFMGICGTAMASLAVYLKQEGFKVFGSDQNVYPPMSLILKQAGIPISVYNKSNIKNFIKLLIVGNVINQKHPEMLAAKKLGIPCLSFPEFLGQTLLSRTKNIVITGTHGKSTCTALMSHVGETAGQNPGFFVGAVPNDFSVSFRSKDSPWFVVEGDEYDSSFFSKKPKFFYYNPFAVLLTGIEFDHGDIYSSLSEITDLFCEFVQKISQSGRLVVCIQNQQLEKVIKRSKVPVITYGLNKGDFRIKNRETKNNRQFFDICYKRVSYPCSIPLFGEHNALNALGVFALSQELGWPVNEVLQGLKTFKGIQRRMELKGEYQGSKIYEDFAHHPTAIRASLSALKEKHPDEKLIAVFEPRSFTSRLNVFQKDYVKAFEKADLIFIAKAYDSSKISKEKRFSVKQLVRNLKQKGKTACCYDRFSTLEFDLFKEFVPGNVLVFMSSGAFGGLLQKMEQNFYISKNFSVEE